LCFLWGTNWIYICYVEESRPPLWSSGQSSWLQIQRSGFDCRHYQIFWEVVGLERGPLSLVSTTEELLGRKSSGSGPVIREYGRGDQLHWPRDTLYWPKLALTSQTSGGHSVGIIRSQTKAMEYFFLQSFSFTLSSWSFMRTHSDIFTELWILPVWDHLLSKIPCTSMGALNVILQDPAAPQLLSQHSDDPNVA
jgi:hypothetical protein